MFRFLCISNLTGSVQFSHYFESVPIQLLINYEKDIVESCLTTGEKEGNIRKSDTFVAFKREGLLLVVVGAVPTANGNIVSDLLHAFVYILVHHMKIMTEMQTVHSKEVIHKILGQMVHGNMLETRISHITALRDFLNPEDGN